MNYTYKCDNCKKLISGEKARNINKFIKSKRQNFGYCSKLCRKEHKYKISHKTVSCLSCGKIFDKQNNDISINNFCSHSCSATYSNKKRAKYDPLDNYKIYRWHCRFKFGLSKYPDEFNFELIKKYGWYSSKNNIGGISRDHMVSVKYGFENKIDPKIISHPANCKLMTQNENIKKFKKCSMSLEELLIRIELWNKKYLYAGG
jgi:hypothetical protein